MSQHWKRRYFSGRIARAGFRIALLPRIIGRWDVVRRRPSTEKQLGSPGLFRSNRHGAVHSCGWVVADRPGAAKRGGNVLSAKDSFMECGNMTFVYIDLGRI